MNTISKDIEMVMVPGLSLEEIVPATVQERATVLAQLEATEAEMKAGTFETYSPEWLDRRFVKIYKEDSAS